MTPPFIAWNIKCILTALYDKIRIRINERKSGKNVYFGTIYRLYQDKFR